MCYNFAHTLLRWRDALLTQDADSKRLLYQARLLVEESRYDAALRVLETICPAERQQRDVAYLLGWCYVQRKQWEDACNVLQSLLGGNEA